MAGFIDQNRDQVPANVGTGVCKTSSEVAYFSRHSRRNRCFTPFWPITWKPK